MNDVDYRLSRLGGTGYSTMLIEGRGSRAAFGETADGSMVRDLRARWLGRVTTSARDLRSGAVTFTIGTGPQ